MKDIFRLIDYILLRFEQWNNKEQLLGNDDAEIFLEAFEKKLDELEEHLLSIQ